MISLDYLNSRLHNNLTRNDIEPDFSSYRLDYPGKGSRKHLMNMN